MSQIISIPPKITPPVLPQAFPRPMPFDLDPSIVFCLVSEMIGTRWLDISRFSNRGIITGAAKTAKGRLGPALSFDGIDDVVMIAVALSIQNIFAGGGSISIWFYPLSDGEGDSGRLINKVRWFLNVTADLSGFQRIAFFKDFDGAADGIWTLTNREIVLSQWNHTIITYDDGDITNDPIFYVNGVKKTVGSGISESVTPIGTTVFDSSNNLFIGNNAGTTRTFDGLIDEVILFNKIVTDIEAANIFEMGRPV